jgi:hypothetical protein
MRSYTISLSIILAGIACVIADSSFSEEIRQPENDIKKEITDLIPKENEQQGLPIKQRVLSGKGGKGGKGYSDDDDDELCCGYGEVCREVDDDGKGGGYEM